MPEEEPKPKAIGQQLYLFRMDPTGKPPDHLVITAHGGISKKGVDTNKFKVPVGVKLHFYVKHGSSSLARSLDFTSLAAHVVETIPDPTSGENESFNYELGKYQGYHGFPTYMKMLKGWLLRKKYEKEGKFPETYSSIRTSLEEHKKSLPGRLQTIGRVTTGGMDRLIRDKHRESYQLKHRTTIPTGQAPPGFDPGAARLEYLRARGIDPDRPPAPFDVLTVRNRFRMKGVNLQYVLNLVLKEYHRYKNVHCSFCRVVD